MRYRIPLSALLLAWALLGLAGCARAGRATADPLRESRWLLTSFVDSQGEHPVPTDFIPFLEIDADSLSFTSTCNTTYATAHMADGQIELERVVDRGVGCDGHISQAALDLETAVPNSMFGWSTYSLQGDELIIPFDGGEIRFSRVLPPNPAGLRAFPLRRANEDKPAYDDAGLQRGPILLQDGCLRVGVADSLFSSYLLLWPPQYAAAFDERTAWATWRGARDVRVGDEVVLSGGRLLEIDPLLDADFLRLASIPPECDGPYWVVEDVIVLATATPTTAAPSVFSASALRDLRVLLPVN